MHLQVKTFSRVAMLSCCSALAIATATRAQPADQSSKLEEVVVTAQRTDQKLQVVPVAVTAFSHASLEKHGISNIEDLQFHAPNINIRDEQASNGLTIGIRGISVQAQNFAYDSAVGV